MNRLLIGAIVALLLLCGGLGWLANSRSEAVARLKTENAALTEAQNRAAKALKRAQGTLRTREAENALQARKLAEAQQGLSEALQRNKAWSDTDVPPDVQEALGGALSGLPDRVQHD